MRILIKHENLNKANYSLPKHIETSMVLIVIESHV